MKWWVPWAERGEEETGPKNKLIKRMGRLTFLLILRIPTNSNMLYLQIFLG